MLDFWFVLGIVVLVLCVTLLIILNLRDQRRYKQEREHQEKLYAEAEPLYPIGTKLCLKKQLYYGDGINLLAGAVGKIEENNSSWCSFKISFPITDSMRLDKWVEVSSLMESSIFSKV